MMSDNLKTPLDLHADTVEAGLSLLESNGLSAFTKEHISALAAIKASRDLRCVNSHANQAIRFSG